MKRGCLYRIGCKCCLYKDELMLSEPMHVQQATVLLYVEQSRKKPYNHKVVIEDRVGWITGYPEWFQELKEEDAKPKD